MEAIYLNPSRRTGSPQADRVLPDVPHWFKWEAYTTWITGIFLMALIYWCGAEIYLTDPGVMELSKPVAIAIGIGSLIVIWIVDDLLCKSPLGNNDATPLPKRCRIH
jgi:uncharacterized membrane protein